MFINSESPPKRDMTVMTVIKEDRLVLLYGG